MSNPTCRCSASTCGCCEGVRRWTPLDRFNRPGLPALRYRAGTHGAFLETMKARLASLEISAPGPDGQTLESYQPLRRLTTRDGDDLAIALLDGWATVADVLTFYEERIANEGYLRTATERRSVLELARLVGYELRPGVAASVYLAYALEPAQSEPVEIPAGSRAQSIPGPGELPQTFETSEALIARPEWNDLGVRRYRPQAIHFEEALTIDRVVAEGTSTSLKTGDLLLLAFQDGVDAVARAVASVEPRFEEKRSVIRLQPVSAHVVQAWPLLREFVRRAAERSDDPVAVRAKRLLDSVALGLAPAPEKWAAVIGPRREEPKALATLVKELGKRIDAVVSTVPPPKPVEVTRPSRFVASLLKPAPPQPTGRLRLDRNLHEAFASGSDTAPQLLVSFAPQQLERTFYTAWANASVAYEAGAELTAVYALRIAAPLFGASVPRIAKYDKDNKLEPIDQWPDWSLDGESGDVLFLDQPYEGVVAGSYVLVERPSELGSPLRLVRRVNVASAVQRSAYGVTGTTTRLALDEDWWDADDMATLRATLVHAQTEKLTLADAPIVEDVSGQEIELAGLHGELTSGRWVIVSGTRTDIPGVSGISASELLMVSRLRHGYDRKLPGDKTHTHVELVTPMAYAYDRSTVVIRANVVKATHGETRHETLGSGDGSQPFQAFTLKQPPLTYLPAPTAAGAASTLEIDVDGIVWRESSTFAGLGPRDRRFVTRTGDEARTTALFGDGAHGARLPTGVENVNAVYRNGIGNAGNVRAGQVTLLQTKPLGVKEVVNPLRASGGADREDRDRARENAPLAVTALDRLVSLQDYADFARTFTGIGKALARRMGDAHRELVHVTIAGAGDAPIDPALDLYRNLCDALRRLGDPDVPLQVDARELIVLVLSARIRTAPDSLWEPVVTKVRTTLLDAFGFEKRSLGQPVFLSEIVAAMQSVPGVAYVDVDAFGGMRETTVSRGRVRLLTLEELAEQVRRIATAPASSKAIGAEPGSLAGEVIRAAPLAIFTPAVPDTLILNPLS